MKKYLLLFALPAVMLSSCGDRSVTPEELPYELTCDVSVTDNGRQFDATLTKDKTSWCFDFTAPESIKGMTVLSENDSYTVTLETLSFTEKSDALPETSPMVLIVKALDMCSSGKGITAVKDGNKTVNKGVVEGADFTLTFEDGAPLSLEIGGEIAVSFK